MKIFNLEYSAQPDSPREKEEEEIVSDAPEEELYLDEEGDDTKAGLDLEAQHREADRIIKEKALKDIMARQDERERKELEQEREEDREELARTFRRF